MLLCDAGHNILVPRQYLLNRAQLIILLDWSSK